MNTIGTFWSFRGDFLHLCNNVLQQHNPVHFLCLLHGLDTDEAEMNSSHELMM